MISQSNVEREASLYYIENKTSMLQANTQTLKFRIFHSLRENLDKPHDIPPEKWRVTMITKCYVDQYIILKV